MPALPPELVAWLQPGAIGAGLAVVWADVRGQSRRIDDLREEIKANEARQREEMKQFREAMKASEDRHQQEIKANEVRQREEMKQFREAMKANEARQREEMKQFREEMKEIRADMKANEVRQQQEMREFREEMKEIRAELAEIKANNRVMNEKLDRLTEAAMAVR